MIKGNWRITQQLAANRIFVSFEPLQAVIVGFG
jgi:hypothetical protein